MGYQDKLDEVLKKFNSKENFQKKSEDDSLEYFYQIRRANTTEPSKNTLRYDFTENDFREGLYNFKDGKSQISFFGSNHMSIKLFYNY